ncbi:hypothetical protein AKI39_18210 [Bordetella sp. H567]|uniref:hypothetical protein n=1 Tax=Bordetella sp. H567 TaxID=1697043 RepID=UPI00081C8DC1|nr:hypothetical protein [Bordetella sp. H567]AOB32237.1 hypothetical protein AKI39_18210 [Bordetella sp. H567]
MEKLGIPTASILGSGFLKQAEVLMKGLGVPLSIGVYPGAPMVDSEEELRRKVESSLAPGLLAGLTGTDAGLDTGMPGMEAEAEQAEPEPDTVILRGDYDEVQEYFHRQMWTDGLPIVPPTRARVDAFLAYTDLDPGHVFRAIPQEGREASVRSIAVTGVMAGCRPEYMPVLVAVVENLCDPAYRVEDSGSTPGWEHMVIVNGPIVKALDFNTGQGVMRFGRQANTSIGRFVRMYLRNICGFRIPPGAGDKCSIGQSFLVALGEDEDSAREIGWPTYAEDRGFAAGENMVTLRSVVSISSPIYSAGDEVMPHVRQWADVIGGSFTYWAHTGFKTGLWSPLILAGPSVAAVIAKQWSKDQVRQYLRDTIKVSAARATHHARMTSTPTFSFERLVREGILPAEYAASDDPERLVNVIIDAAMVEIVVAGDAGRNQSRAYMSNHVQGPPTSRKVRLPKDWDRLLAQARK